MDLCEAKSWFYDAQYLTSTAFVSAVVSIISRNGVDTVHYWVVYVYVYASNVAQLLYCNDTVHYGVVYVYVYANDVAQLLYYNIQRLNPYDNNKCNNNSLKYVILDHTVRIQDDDTVNYVVNDILSLIHI